MQGSVHYANLGSHQGRQILTLPFPITGMTQREAAEGGGGMQRQLQDSRRVAVAGSQFRATPIWPGQVTCGLKSFSNVAYKTQNYNTE